MTRRDVAERAGVSVATVSNVLNGTKRVTPEVERRVREAVEELGYRPNLIARGLATHESRHAVVLVDSLCSPRAAALVEGAQAEASEHGYILSVISLCMSDPRSVRELASRGVDGVLLAAEDIERCVTELSGLPMAQIEPEMFEVQPAVDDLVRALAAFGHRRIAFLGSSASRALPKARYAAWRTAMERAGLPVEPALVVDLLPDALAAEAWGQRAMESLLARNVPFTAVCAASDAMAIGAMRALSRAGRAVPGDVSVAGFDGLPIAEALTPTLATVDVRLIEGGRLLIRRLLEQIGSCEGHAETIVARYAAGDSVRACRQHI